MCAAVFHQWVHKYCPLKCQLSLACRRNTYLWQHPSNNSSDTRWPNDISSAADNAIFKNMAQNIECSFSCVTRSADLLKLNVGNILLFNICEQKFFQHGPITIAIACNDFPLLIFELLLQLCLWTKMRTKHWLVLGASALQYMHVGILCRKCDNFACLHTRQNRIISFIWKDSFFLPKSGPLSEVKFKPIHNHIRSAEE